MKKHLHNIAKKHLALRHRTLLGFGAIAILLKVLTFTTSLALPSSNTYADAITPANIITLTNMARQDANIPLLTASRTLAQAAQAKAQDMLTNQYFAHTSPAGITPWSWFQKFGYAYLYGAENLAVHYSDAEGVQKGWMLSPSHRANILNRRYTETGVGIAMGDFEGARSIFVVQLFGKPIEPTLTSVTATTTAGAIPQPKLSQEAKNIKMQQTTIKTEQPTSTVAGIESQTDAIEPMEPRVSIQRLSDAYIPPLRSDITTADAIDDRVKKTYVALMAFLTTSLVLSAFLKFNRQRVSIAAHALGVISLLTALLAL